MIRQDLGVPLEALSLAAVRVGYSSRTGTLMPANPPARPPGPYSTLVALAVLHGLVCGVLMAEAATSARPYDWEVDGL